MGKVQNVVLKFIFNSNNIGINDSKGAGQLPRLLSSYLQGMFVVPLFHQMRRCSPQVCARKFPIQLLCLA